MEGAKFSGNRISAFGDKGLGNDPKKLEKYLNFRFEAKSSWGSGAGIVGDASG